MICYQCGKENKDGQKFCKYCGASLTPKADPVQMKTEPIRHQTTKEKAVYGTVFDEDGSENEYEDEYEEGRTSKILIGIVVVLVLLIIAGGIFLLIALSKQGGPDNEASEAASGSDMETTNEAIGANVSGEEDGDILETAPDTDSGAMAVIENTAPYEQETGEKEEDTHIKNMAIHRYEVFTEDVTWSEAFESCLEKGGYLARIDSEKEYNTICDLLDGMGVTGIAYIGGRRNLDSDAYHWVGSNGELYDYDVSRDEYRKFWLDGEPSYEDSVDGETIDESYMSMLYRKSEDKWYWNDICNDVLSIAPNYYTGNISYICEYE